MMMGSVMALTIWARFLPIYGLHNSQLLPALKRFKAVTELKLRRNWDLNVWLAQFSAVACFKGHTVFQAKNFWYPKGIGVQKQYQIYPQWNVYEWKIVIFYRFLVQVLLYSVYVFLVISCLLLDAFCFLIVIFILELIRKMQELRNIFRLQWRILDVPLYFEEIHFGKGE